MLKRMGCIGLLMLTACRYDGTNTKMQWAPDMADSPAVKPQKSYLDPPMGAVAMNAHFYAASPEDSETAEAMPEAIKNDPSGRALERGRWLFQTFCSMCHGLDGKGMGTLGPNYPQPPDITHATYKERKDGFFFYRITFGTALMPGYGHAIDRDERWMIIKHLRTLQQK